MRLNLQCRFCVNFSPSTACKNKTAQILAHVSLASKLAWKYAEYCHNTPVVAAYSSYFRVSIANRLGILAYPTMLCVLLSFFLFLAELVLTGHWCTLTTQIPSSAFSRILVKIVERFMFIQESLLYLVVFSFFPSAIGAESQELLL